MRLRPLAFIFVLVAPVAFATGCAQGVGDRCQVQSDCATNLICVLPAGGTPQAGGTCQPENTADGGLSTDMAFTADMHVPVDMSMHD
jgi:hypothetical protein